MQKKIRYFGLIRTNLHYIQCKFSIIVLKIYDETAPSKRALWDEFSEQYQHQSIKKNIFNAQLSLYDANKMQISGIFYFGTSGQNGISCKKIKEKFGKEIIFLPLPK